MPQCIYETILKEYQQTKLMEYKGNLRSVTTGIITIGKMNSNKCKFNINNTLNNMEIIVIDNQDCNNKCITGNKCI